MFCSGLERGLDCLDLFLIPALADGQRYGSKGNQKLYLKNRLCKTLYAPVLSQSDNSEDRGDPGS